MKTAAALLLLALLTAAAPAGAADHVIFASRVEVGGERVTLLDLVEPGLDLSDALKEQLGRYTAAVAPALGRSSVLMGAKIRSLMRQANLGEGVSVLIPEQVVVARASQRLSAQDLTRLYIEAVTERLGPKASEADISRVEAGNDLILPAGRLDTNLRFLSSSLIGRVPALIEVMVDGRREALARVVGTVDIYAQVAVAARPLMQRHVLGPEDVAMARISLNEAGPGAIFEAQEAIGMRARAMVPLGAPLDLTRLEKTPLVRLGEVVVMVYNDGGLRITAKGRAEQTGYLGGRIRLTNLASRREVYGKVLEAGRVLVD